MSFFSNLKFYQKTSLKIIFLPVQLYRQNYRQKKVGLNVCIPDIPYGQLIWLWTKVLAQLYSVYLSGHFCKIKPWLKCYSIIFCQLQVTYFFGVKLPTNWWKIRKIISSMAKMSKISYSILLYKIVTFCKTNFNIKFWCCNVDIPTLKEY